jgi:hypothetical protein
MLACLTPLQDLWLFMWSQILNSLGLGLSIMTSSWLLRINLIINFFLLVEIFFFKKIKKFKLFWRFSIARSEKNNYQNC